MTLGSTFKLPGKDQSRSLPYPVIGNKRARIHSPPHEIQSTVSRDDNFRALKQQLRSMDRAARNMTPNTVLLVRLLKRDIADWERLDKTKHRREASERAEDIEILAGYMQARMKEVHGENGLCQFILDYYSQIAETKLLLDFGDFLAVDLNNFKNKTYGATWTNAPGGGYDFQEISEMIFQERESIKKYGCVIPSHRKSEKGVVKELELAAEKLGLNAAQLEWQIHVYADRNYAAHSGVKKMLEEGRMGDVARCIIDGRMSLHMACTDQNEQMRWQNAIKAVEEQYFERIYDKTYLSGGQIEYQVTKLGQKKLDARFKRLKEDEERVMLKEKLERARKLRKSFDRQ